MPAVVADLHVHTPVSDGTLPLEEVPAAARDADLEAVAVTDHDRYHPGFDHPVEVRDGVTLVRGIELRVEADDQRLDLLGYGLEPTTDLTAEVERIQRDRVERGRRIIENVEAHTGADLDVEPREGLGRPHIARAIERSDADYDYEAAFDRLIGDDGPCFVARDVPPLARGVALLEEACAVVGLAHPLRYPDPAAALDIAAGLDAVELYYPYDRPMDPDDLEAGDDVGDDADSVGDDAVEDADAVGRGAVEDAIAANDLLATGGSDAHDRTLGRAGLPDPDWERVRERLPEPVSRE